MTVQTFVVASHNKGKLAEFGRILGPFGIVVVSMGEAGFLGDIVEDGDTFAQNAEIKARAVMEATNMPAIADDSGLCIDWLGGRPGVLSARYHGEGTPYSEKLSLLLAEMEDCPEAERTARFVSAIAYVGADGACHLFEAACEGVIGHAPAGSGGFGYDPVFYVEGGSFAELSPEEKDRVSHRGKALRAFVAALPELLK